MPFIPLFLYSDEPTKYKKFETEDAFVCVPLIS
jgi:hypothetical protein